MAVSSILIPVSNARHNHVSLSFASEPLPIVDVASILKSQLSGMAADLRAMAPRTTAAATIYRGNSKEVRAILPEGAGVSAVITSPPYPNRFSYARETRPHLFFFDFIENAAAVGRLETEAIGGTWGRATSVLYRGIAPKNRLIERLLEPYFRETPARGAVMASYVAKYFNDLFDHAAGIAEVCNSGRGWIRDREQQVLRPPPCQRSDPGGGLRALRVPARAHRPDAKASEQDRPARVGRLHAAPAASQRAVLITAGNSVPLG